MALPQQSVDNLCYRLKALGAPKVHSMHFIMHVHVHIISEVFQLNIILVAFMEVDKLIVKKFAHRSEPELLSTSLSWFYQESYRHGSSFKLLLHIIPSGPIIRKQQSVAAAAVASLLLLQWHYNASSLTRCQGMRGWSHNSWLALATLNGSNRDQLAQQRPKKV